MLFFSNVILVSNTAVSHSYMILHLWKKKKSVRLLVFCLAPLDPLFEQVFVVAVSPRSKSEHSFVGELAAVGVDEHGHQAILLARQLVDKLHYFIHNFLERM